MVLSVHTASTDEVDEGMRVAGAAGARLVEPAEAAPAGVYTGLFADPDGHVWEVVFNPAYPLGADGRYQLP